MQKQNLYPKFSTGWKMFFMSMVVLNVVVGNKVALQVFPITHPQQLRKHSEASIAMTPQLAETFYSTPTFCAFWVAQQEATAWKRPGNLFSNFFIALPHNICLINEEFQSNLQKSWEVNPGPQCVEKQQILLSLIKPMTVTLQHRHAEQIELAIDILIALCRIYV